MGASRLIITVLLHYARVKDNGRKTLIKRATYIFLVAAFALSTDQGDLEHGYNSRRLFIK